MITKINRNNQQIIINRKLDQQLNSMMEKILDSNRAYVGINFFENEYQEVIDYKINWENTDRDLFITLLREYAYEIKKTIDSDKEQIGKIKQNFFIKVEKLISDKKTIYTKLTDCKNSILKIGIARLSSEDLKDNVQDYDFEQLGFDIAIDFRNENFESAIKGYHFLALYKELTELSKEFPNKILYCEILGDSSRTARGFGTFEGIEFLINLLRSDSIYIHDFLKLFSEGLQKLDLEKTAIGNIKSKHEDLNQRAKNHKSGLSSLETFAKTRLEAKEELALRYGLEIGNKEFVEFLKSNYYNQTQTQKENEELKKENEELKARLERLERMVLKE